MTRYYWFSFSYKGTNQGVCMVESHSKESALQKTIDLNIHPKHDSIKMFDAKAIPENKEIELDRLYSKQEMIALNYTSDNP